MKEKIINITKEVVPYILVILLALFIRAFIASPVRVNGTSMVDTLKEGDILILNKIGTMSLPIYLFGSVLHSQIRSLRIPLHQKE